MDIKNLFKPRTPQPKGKFAFVAKSLLVVGILLILFNRWGSRVSTLFIVGASLIFVAQIVLFFTARRQGMKRYAQTIAISAVAVVVLAIIFIVASSGLDHIVANK